MSIVPEEIKALRPTNFGACEVRAIGGHYYVYPFSCKYQKDTKKRKKITGKMIGKITLADGFIPNKYGLELLKKQKPVEEVSDTVVTAKSYGAYKLLDSISPDIYQKLKDFFPDCFREIRAFSLIRLIDKVSPKLVKDFFERSIFSELSPDIGTSEATVRKFISSLGERGDDINAMMSSYINKESVLLFDGTTMFTRMNDSLAAKGYNPNHKSSTQSRILYIFDQVSHKPLFYKILQGSIVDKKAFIDIIVESGCYKSNSLVIADKGFYSTKNVSFLKNAGLSYILPLQSNTALIDQEFYANTDDNKFNGVFSYHKRAIYHYKRKCGENWVYIFRDDNRRADLKAHFIEKAEANYDEDKYKPMDVVNEIRLGHFAFVSNLDEDPKEIYLKYKQRWDIEECFDYLKNNVMVSAPYAHDNSYFRGVTFLNHISLLYYYGLIKRIKDSSLKDKYTPDEIIKLTREIEKITLNEKEYISGMTKRVKDILTELDADVVRNF